MITDYYICTLQEAINNGVIENPESITHVVCLNDDGDVADTHVIESVDDLAPLMDHGFNGNCINTTEDGDIIAHTVTVIEPASCQHYLDSCVTRSSAI